MGRATYHWSLRHRLRGRRCRTPPGRPPPLAFEVSLVSGHNVAALSSGSPTSRLEYQGPTLIRFVPDSDAFTVTFEQVGTADNGRIRGFLVLETSVGRLSQKRVDRKFPAGTDVNAIHEGDERKVFGKEEGHHMFTLSRRVEGGLVIGTFNQ